MAPMAADDGRPANRILIDLKFSDSEVRTLTRKTGPGSLQRSSVQPTIAISESISNVNISFCT